MTLLEKAAIAVIIIYATFLFSHIMGAIHGEEESKEGQEKASTAQSSGAYVTQSGKED